MNVHICIGSSCYLKGSKDIITILERLITIHNVKDKVTIDDEDKIYSLSPAKTEEFFVKEILGRLKK